MGVLEDEKLFYQRFMALHSNSMLLGIFQNFGIAVFRRSSVLEGFEQFIVEQKFEGRFCLEIGSCKGLTALVLSKYFGTVVSLDTYPDPDKQIIAARCEVANVGFIDIKDNVEKAAVIKRLDFDAAYVDGDHTHDTELDFSLVRRCGCVLFHEYWEAQPPVWRLINKLKAHGENVVTHGKLALWRAK